ncbi:ABC transporter substrate-binding protein [Streptomyces acidicola]|uniref:ABC transporter substrate-binding protein n=1 Tax=Streptomyces acidicola TaxID=2596892 RepID=UPI003812237C
MAICMGRRTASRSVLALAMSSVLVTGCQSAVDRQDQGAREQSSANCRQGGTMVVASALAPLPGRVLALSAANLTWVRGVFEPLVAVKNGDVANPVPLLATKWKLSDDDHTLVLDLRQGVTFHNGRPLTADDVVFSFKRALDPTVPSDDKQILQDWKIEATGQHEVTIRSTTPLSPVFATVLDDTPIVDRSTYAGLADGSKIIGTGPYTVESYRPGAEIVLVRNKSYWQKGLPHLDRIESVVVPDSTAQLSALRSGRTQVASGLTTQDAATVAKDGSQFKLTETRQAIYTIVLDPRKGVFADKAVRQAIGYALDRDRIVQQVFAGKGRTDGLLWPRDAAYPKDLENAYPYDPAKAKKLIRQAGATGAEVPITILNNPQLQAVYQIVANNLTEAGLRPVLKALAAPDYQARLAAGTAGNYLAFRSQATTDSLLAQTNPDVRLVGANRQFSTSEYTDLVKGVVRAGSGTGSAQAVHELTAYVLDQAVVQTLVTTPAITVTSTKVKGFASSNGGVLLRDTCLMP